MGIVTITPLLPKLPPVVVVNTLSFPGIWTILINPDRVIYAETGINLIPQRINLALHQRAVLEDALPH